jgi:predicted DNA-binding WGR domain protein
VRQALESGDSEGAEAAAHALARAGEGDAAATFLPLMARGGRDVGGLLERLAPPSLDAFALRTLGTRFGQERVGALTWAPDAQSLAAITGRGGDRVVRMERSSGEVQLLATLPRYGRSIAVDEAGRLALCVKNAGEDGTEVFLLEPGARAPDAELPPPLVSGSDWYRALALSPFPDLLVAVSPRSVRGFARAKPRARAAWAVGGEAVAFGLGGAVSYKKVGRRLRLLELKARKPRAQVALDEVCPESHLTFLRPYPELAVAGAGALVLDQVRRKGSPTPRLIWEAEVDWRATRLGADGAVLGQVTLPVGRLRSWSASPSGRFLLATQHAEEDAPTARSPDVTLVDLLDGSARPFTLPALPRSSAWSPSGQTLAIGTDEGTVVLLDGGGRPAGETTPEPAAASPEDGWTELAKAGRFWRARRDGAAVEVHWGARGTQGQRRRSEQSSEEQAAKELAKRIAAKRRDGYDEVE